MQQGQGDTKLITSLHGQERLIEARKIGGQKQSDVRSFLRPEFVCKPEIYI